MYDIIIASYKRFPNINMQAYGSKKIILIIDEPDTKNKLNNIKTIINLKRIGKSAAINQALPFCKSDIVILMSADIILKKNAIKEILKPFKNPNVGVVNSQVIPKNQKKGLGKVIHLLWKMHNDLPEPKFGELIAFRNKIKKIPLTIVDEEEIANLILEQGYKKAKSSAICYNLGPKNLKELIRQRRRIYCGHLDLEKRKHTKIPSNRYIYLIPLVFKSLFKSPLTTLYLIIIEIIARIFGIYDYLTNKKKHYLWKVSPSTKKL